MSVPPAVVKMYAAVQTSSNPPRRNVFTTDNRAYVASAREEWEAKLETVLPVFPVSLNIYTSPDVAYGMKFLFPSGSIGIWTCSRIADCLPGSRKQTSPSSLTNQAISFPVFPFGQYTHGEIYGVARNLLPFFFSTVSFVCPVDFIRFRDLFAGSFCSLKLQVFIWNSLLQFYYRGGI